MLRDRRPHISLSLAVVSFLVFALINILDWSNLSMVWQNVGAGIAWLLLLTSISFGISSWRSALSKTVVVCVIIIAFVSIACCWSKLSQFEANNRVPDIHRGTGP